MYSILHLVREAPSSALTISIQSVEETDSFTDEIVTGSVLRSVIECIQRKVRPVLKQLPIVIGSRRPQLKSQKVLGANS